MGICAHCGGSGHVPDSADDLANAMRSACRERGIYLSADDRVREDGAAALLGLKAKTLSNRRYADAPIPYVMRQGRPHYLLIDLAAWQAQGK